MNVLADLAPFAANPGIALAAAALLLPFLPTAVARIYAPAAALAALTYAVGLQPGSHSALAVMGMDLQILRVDAAARLFALVFLAVAFLAMVYAWRLGDRTQRAAGLVLAGAATAAVYCADLLSFLVFSGLATIASVFLIWATGTERGLRAGTRYMVIQVAAVVVLLAGVVMYVHATGAISLTILPAGTPGVGLILAALGVQAAFPLVHSWLRDAYAEATPVGSVLLSAFTTKLALYALFRGYAGTEALVWIGAAMIVLPLIVAAVESDLRRALAWVLNSQLGIVVLAIGIGSETALNGALGFAVTHTLSMALMFMAVGAVLTRTGTAQAAELGGLRTTMPWTAGFYLIGAATAGLPLFGGFAGLPMIVDAAATGHWLPRAALLVGIAGGFLILLGRLPYRMFLGASKTPIAGGEPPASMLAAMAIAAVLCVVLGVWPPVLHGALPFPIDRPAFAFFPLATLVLLAAAGIGAFAALLQTRLYPADRATVPDVDWLYRRALPVVLVEVGRGIDAAWGRFIGSCQALIAGGVAFIGRLFVPGGPVGRMMRVGNGVTWVAAMLLVTLLVGFAAN